MSAEGTARGGEAPVGGAVRSDRVWCAVSALDVFAAALTRGGDWPAVLRPASVAQRLDAAGAAHEAGSTVGRSEPLCSAAFRLAEAAPVRSVHWFLGSRGTTIAETAWGRASCAVLVGWAPHEHDSAPASDRPPLPGALLLGVFGTADTARRLAELVPQAVQGDGAVVGRWALPQGCPPMSVRSVVHPQPGVLRRELVTQLTEALVRVQEGAHGPDRPDRVHEHTQEQEPEQYRRTQDRRTRGPAR